MNATVWRTLRGAMALLVVGTLAGALAAPVVASHVAVRTSFPGDGTVGQIVPLAVDLRTRDNAPLAGTTVTYYLHVSFAGVEDETEIGRAVTDDNGVAEIQYRPRTAGLHEVRMEYMAPGAATAEELVATFDVAGGTQLVRSAGSVDIPGVNPGLLMAVLGTVWLILLSVAFRLVAIARAGDATEPPSGDAAK